MAVLKYSRQREAIKNYLANTTSHPTAETVYETIRTIYPNISLGTVYRNLNLLAEQGEALKLSYGNGGDHFDGNVSPHNHFVCTCCNRIFDLELPSLEHINHLAAENFSGTIEGHLLYFYGKCQDCT